jgi:hypothetical protein
MAAIASRCKGKNNMAKTRSDSILLNLPEEQQAALSDWLLNGTPYHIARERVAKEFGVTVGSLSCFSAFWSEVCQPALLARRQRAAGAAEAIGAFASQDSAFDKGFVSALKQKAFELSNQPDVDPQALAMVIGQALKLRDQDLKQEDLQLKRDKFQFDAAKACLAALPALKAIASDSSLDNNGKINAIRAKLFGQLPQESAA